MAELIYSAICSLDGYTEDASGDFAWAAPDAEVHAFVNDLERPIGTYLYGRRMYETMAVWENPAEIGTEPEVLDFGAVWASARKVVYSRTLESVHTKNTTLEREFDADAVRRMKAEASADISIGGPALGAQALAAGLVDECWFLLVPTVVGGGKRALPDGMRMSLYLVEQAAFSSGMVYLNYRLR